MSLYSVTYSNLAIEDIERIPLKEEETKALVSFLKSDGCRVIGKRQQQINYELDIWYFRLPLLLRGARGGGRCLYYRRENNIYIYRIFNKKEIDNDGNKSRKRVFEIALEELKNILR
ncbi:MAG: hypothetical protein PHF88_02065 [Candidatus Pacebacteria bacterium]|nr:hypothetical protein [Candidatus Paceibacterota bacterium]